MFTFSSEIGANRPLEGGPCVADGCCLILSRWEANKRIEEVEINSVAVWVQIHGLTRDHTLVRICVQLGQLVGSIAKVEGLDSGIRRKV